METRGSMEFVHLGSVAARKRVRVRDALAVNRAKDFSVPFQDKLSLRISLQPQADEAFGADWILMGKSVDPAGLSAIGWSRCNRRTQS
jgi:hypothetical protein